MKIIATLYAVMDKRPLRALSLVMALLLAGCIF
ncbi:cyd operon protein YbgE, partial [Enterobacter cloacae]|nr:cyd operon protein YbgE [Enterobacter cloacae]